MRPIDADAVIKNLGDISVGKNRFDRGIEAGISNAILRLENAPTLTLDDLRPKGRWIPLRQRTYGNGRSYTHYCSECGQHGFEDYALCHDCGADMRGGGEDG